MLVYHYNQYPIIPDLSEGYKSVPIELFVHVWCVCACMLHAKSAELAHLNQLFLQVGASLGCHTIGRLDTYRVLPRHGQVMPMLRKVYA